MAIESHPLFHFPNFELNSYLNPAIHLSPFHNPPSIPPFPNLPPSKPQPLKRRKPNLHRGFLPNHIQPQIAIPIHLISVQQLPIKTPAQLGDDDAQDEIRHGLAEAVARPDAEGAECAALVGGEGGLVLRVGCGEPALGLEVVGLGEVARGVRGGVGAGGNDDLR